jgi:hypothetical protein
VCSQIGSDEVSGFVEELVQKVEPQIVGTISRTLSVLRLGRAALDEVMRGLDPRIHLLVIRRWIAGSSPAMTADIQPYRKTLSGFRSR